MKRPMLVSGIALAFTCAVLVYIGTVAATLLLMASATVFILYFIKPLNLRNKIIIPAICISVIIGSVTFLVYHNAKIEPLLKYNNTTEYIAGKITDIPRYNNGYTTFTIKTEKIGEERIFADIFIKIKGENTEAFEPEDYVSLTGKIKLSLNEYNKPSPSSVANKTFIQIIANDCNTLWKGEKSFTSFCLKLKTDICNQIDAFLNTDEAGFLKGMLFGDKSDINDSVLRDFRNSGVAHLLAVSGLHTSLWCGLLICILSFFRIKEKIRNIICIIFLVFFCIISAFTPSVLRASLMMAIILIAPFFKRQPDSFNSLGIALFVLILTNPYTISSTSFQLSVAATGGVLSAKNINYNIVNKTKSIKFTPVKKLADYVLTSLTISIFAGLFTLPVSAFSFGVISAAAPLTNLLVVKLSFWGMITGSISTAISYIPFSATKNFSILFFRLTTCLLNTSTNITSSISKCKYASFPVSEKGLIAGFLTLLAILFILFLTIRKNQIKKHLKSISVICTTTILFCSLLPGFSPIKTYITIPFIGDDLNISIRSGLNYGFFNLITDENNNLTNYLPKATIEKLEFIYIADCGSYADRLSDKLFTYEPETTYTTKYVQEYYHHKERKFYQNTLINHQHNFVFNNKINIKIVDTYNTNYVIIKGNKKSVFICYGNNTDFNDLFSNYGTPDILVLSAKIPETLPENVNTLVISSNSDIIINKNALQLKKQCTNYYTTAENGDITLTL